MIDPEKKFKLVDDLTLLKIINLISIRMSSFNVKFRVPSYIPDHNGYIHPEHLKTQSYLNDITNWTNKKMMKTNTNKTKVMIFNFTQNHQFTTRLTMDDDKIEVVENTKLLGTHITNDLTWDLNTQHIVKKSNARMQLLRKVASFGASRADMVHIYKLFVRSALEHSSSVWHKSLTLENVNDLKRVQKSAFRVILGTEYSSYENALNTLNIETLSERRKSLFNKFTLKSVQVTQMKYILKEKTKIHPMVTRNTENFEVSRTNTKRFRKSAGIQMQKTLNEIT